LRNPSFSTDSEAGLRSLTFEDLITQLLEEDEVSKYQEGKEFFSERKGSKVKGIKSKTRATRALRSLRI
jgi:hypothetical protein